MGERGKNQRERASFEGAGSSFSLEPALLTWQTTPGIARSLILIGPGSCLISVSGHDPSSPGGRCGVSGCRAVTLRGVDGEVTICLLLLMT